MEDVELKLLGMALSGLVTGIGALAWVAKHSLNRSRGNGHVPPCNGLKKLQSEQQEEAKDIATLKTDVAVMKTSQATQGEQISRLVTNTDKLVDRFIDQHKTSPYG